MRTRSSHEELARDRRRFERLLLARMGTSITREDAEDIVSEALLRAHRKLETDPPRRGAEGPWFARMVVNLGIDFIRARDGRPRNGSARPRAIALDEVAEDGPAPNELDADGPPGVAELADEVEREQARELVRRVMASMDPRDAELVKLKHLTAAHATRQEIAAMAGMTLGEFRHRYARAWARFIDAVALDAPTERCHRTRQLLGELEAGTAPAEVAHEIDAHCLDCASCRVFARESYRALELMPFVPVVGFTERWSRRIATLWDRTGPEAAAVGGTAAASGFWAMIASGGPVAVVKAVALLCTATAVTAGLCAGVVTVVGKLDSPPPDRRAEKRERQKAKSRRTATPTPTVVVAVTPTPTPKPRPTRTPAPPRERPTSTPQPETQPPPVDTSGETAIPASAPADGTEFEPSASSVSNDPAPATDAGGGEFAP